MNDTDLRTLERAGLHDPVARRRWRFARWRDGGAFFERGERFVWRCPQWFMWHDSGQPNAEQTYYSSLETPSVLMGNPITFHGEGLNDQILRPLGLMAVVIDGSRADVREGGPHVWLLSVVKRWQEFDNE